MSCTIRNASESDIPILVRIIRESFKDVAERFNLTAENCPRHPSNCDRSWIESALGKDVCYFVLEHRGVPCGCVALQQVQPEVCYLERLAVLPEFRRKGFGKALVDHILDRACSQGAERVEIGIISDQHDLKAWYRNIGFEETETAEYPHLPFKVAFMALAL